MGAVFEMIMVIFFGLSWPSSILRSYRSRTSRGKSLPFLMLIWVGYLCGIAGKIISGNITYVLVFYCINVVMVSIDILMYFRNVKLDRQAQM